MASNDKDLDRQPTMRDLIALLSDKSSKEDIETIKKHISSYKEEQNEKISAIESNVTNIAESTQINSGRIETLENTIETLKQDKLRNNICISGMPDGWDGNSNELVLKIAKKLNVNVSSNDFTAYTTSRNKFVIASFHNFAHKQTLLNKLRVKKSLMVEEVYASIKSNNQIYLNEHLTPYFSHLFQIARKAKKDNKLTSATSHGGKIRVRKHKDDAPTIITNENQLQQIIELYIELNTSTGSSAENVDNNNNKGNNSQSAKDTHSSKNNNNTDKRTRKNVMMGPKSERKRKANRNSPGIDQPPAKKGISQY